MDITFLGHSSFRIRGKQVTLITDPYDPDMVGLKYPKQAAEIVTVSHEHKDHGFLDRVEGVRKVIKGPGEYEVSGVNIFGYPSFHDGEEGASRGKNTIYLIEMDEISLVHLGDLGHDLGDKSIGEISEVDILMVPVGGVYTIDAKQAAEVVKALEPKFILPMHYQTPGLKQDSFSGLAGVDEFVKELGLEAQKTDKLTIKKDDLTAEGQKLVILEKK